MKRHLNTLFIMTEGAYLAKDGQALAVRVEKQTRLRVPIHHLDGVVCFGRVGLSPAVMTACAEAGVTISLVSSHGRFRAAVVGYSPGNVLLRREQYRRADDAAGACAVARHIVAAKLANCRSVLLRAVRDRAESEACRRLATAAERIVSCIRSAQLAGSLDQLRGVEGEAANHYFGVFGDLTTHEDEAFRFASRNRRPPLDPMNALLSFVYSVLAHDARSACEAAGLDAAVGFLHRDRSGRPGLALDLMEEFRPFLADRIALSLVNRRQVTAGDFDRSESGAVLMSEAARKRVLATYQKRKQDEIVHPFLGEKTTVGLLVHLQARLLARHLRGDLDAYPPFVWK